jgi:hypothetical protein
VVNTGLQPVFYAGLRSAIALLCLLVWFRIKGRSLKVAPEARGRRRAARRAVSAARRSWRSCGSLR